ACSGPSQSNRTGSGSDRVGPLWKGPHPVATAPGSVRAEVKIRCVLPTGQAHFLNLKWPLQMRQVINRMVSQAEGIAHYDFHLILFGEDKVEESQYLIF